MNAQVIPVLWAVLAGRSRPHAPPSPGGAYGVPRAVPSWLIPYREPTGRQSLAASELLGAPRDRRPRAASRPRARVAAQENQGRFALEAAKIFSRAAS